MAIQDQESEIDFFQLLRYLLESWGFVLACVLVTVIYVAYGLRNTQPTYEAIMVVAPPAGDSGSGMASSTLGSVLSTLGGGGGGSSSPQFDEFQYKMTSPSVVRAANADGRLYAWLYPGLWDPETRGWIKPSGASQFFLGIVRAFFHKPAWIAPDEVMTSETLQKQIIFEPIPKSSLTRVRYQNTDPGIATAMLQRLYSEADRQIREQEQLKLKTQMSNANEVLGQTQNSDLRIAMAQQLAQSQYRLLNVPGNTDYSARLVEPPFVSSLPVAPKIGWSLALAAAISAALSAFAAVAYRVLAAELVRRGKLAPVQQVRSLLARRPRLS